MKATKGSIPFGVKLRAGSGTKVQPRSNESGNGAGGGCKNVAIEIYLVDDTHDMTLVGQNLLPLSAALVAVSVAVISYMFKKRRDRSGPVLLVSRSSLVAQATWGTFKA